MKKFDVRVLVTCNRCAHEDEWLEETPDYLRYEWSELTLGGKDIQLDEPKTTQRVRFDLCPACTREVKAWIRNGR